MENERRCGESPAAGLGSGLADLPEYIAERVRQPPKVGPVVSGSSPVVAFGNARRARVATLGLNPSRLEFLDRAGRELDGANRRLETLASLSIASLEEAPDEVIGRVVSACDGYFWRNPYRRWFDQLEGILSGMEVTYYGGSACHLDLVQWATDPVWRQLSAHDRKGFLDADQPFLLAQLRKERIEVLLLNGQAVIERYQAATDSRLRPAGELKASGRATLLREGAFGDIRVVGWSVNIQSSFGVSNELRTRLRDRVALLASA